MTLILMFRFFYLCLYSFSNVIFLKTPENSWLSQEHTQSLSRSASKRRLYKCKYRGFTKRNKPLVTLKNKMIRLDFDRKPLKEPAQFWKQKLCTDETMMNVPEWWEQKNLANERKNKMNQTRPHSLSNLVGAVSWYGHVWVPQATSVYWSCDCW